MEQSESVVEDLMSEHSLLDRVLLIYEEIISRMENNKPFDRGIIKAAALIIRAFIEDFHEPNEEAYIFPVLIKHHKEVELVNELISQHRLSRTLTDTIIKLSEEKIINKQLANGNKQAIDGHKQLLMDPEKINKQQLIINMQKFVYLYRFHESREDTVVFREFKKLISEKEYKRIGKILEEAEEKKFGKDGYENILGFVEALEKLLDIYDLKKITNKIKS